MARRNEDDKDVKEYRGKRFDMRALMAKYDVSISDLANGTGLSYGSVQSLIRLNRPSMTNLYKIAQALSCDVTELSIATDVDVSVLEPSSTPETKTIHDAITCPYCSKRFLLLD